MYILTTRKERKMVTKEDVEKAKAAAKAAEAVYEAATFADELAADEAADAAWEEYVKLKEEFENAN